MTGQPSDALRGARILVTGAGGFIGANLVRALLRRGLSIQAMTGPRARAPRLAPLEGHPGLTLLPFDLTDNPAPLVSERGFDLVFHLAAAMPGGAPANAPRHAPGDSPPDAALPTAAGADRPPPGADLPQAPFRPVPGTARPVAHEQAHQDAAHAVNVTATLRLAEALAARGGVLLFAGSVSEYAASDALLDEGVPPAPATAYGGHKALAVAGLEALGAPEAWCVLRLFGVYGPLEAANRLIPYIARRLAAGREALLTHGLQVRDFVYVDDVAEAFLRAAARPAARGRAYNIGSGAGTTVRQAALMAAEILGRPDLLRFGAVESASAAPDRFVADNSLAARELDWRPATDLPRGVALTVRWAVEDSDA